MTHTQDKHKGFTIIELIVVAAIISLLVAVVLARLDVSRAKARDTAKVQELKELQKALELYQLDINRYPSSQETPGSPVAARNGGGTSDMSRVLQGIVDNGYLSKIPTPPSRSAIPGIDMYVYQTRKDPSGSAVNPECNGVDLDFLPYIIYFYTEQPQKLPLLTLNGVSQQSSQSHGHCLTLQ